MKANIDIKKEAKRVVFGLAGAIIMAVNIKTFVRAGGLYPGGFNGVTLLIQTVFQRFLGIALPVYSGQSVIERCTDNCMFQMRSVRNSL